MDDTELRAAVAASLREYAASDAHDLECIGYSEGQFCCIDDGHRYFENLVDAIVQGVRNSQVAPYG